MNFRHYTYVVFHGKILYPPDFPLPPEPKNGRYIVRFELPPKLSGSGLFDVTKMDEYKMPSARHRFAIRTVKHIGFAGDYVSGSEAERIIERRERIELRRELHDAERRVKDCREELCEAAAARRKFRRLVHEGAFDTGIVACDLKHRLDAETGRRLTEAQSGMVYASLSLWRMLLGIGTISAEEFERRMKNCGDDLRGYS